MRYALLLLPLVLSCGGTGSQPDPHVPGQYILHWCAREADCQAEAEKTCAPRGYRYTSWRDRPEKFVCVDE
jgi:hypothetical protein